MSISISKDVLTQELQDETVLLDLDSENYFGLDSVGTRIWQLLNEGQDEVAIVARSIGERHLWAPESSQRGGIDQDCLNRLRTGISSRT
jgi:hypothetical protein